MSEPTWPKRCRLCGVDIADEKALDEHVERRAGYGACYKCGRAPDRTLDERGKMRVELRPYGPGGADVCYECANATPEAAAQTAAAFGALLDASTAASPTGTAVIGAGHGRGPDPFDAREIDPDAEVVHGND